MASIIGCSISTQCPQGSVGSQFNVEVKQLSQQHVSESLNPDEVLDIPVVGAPASVNIQSDYPVELRFTWADGDSVEVALKGAKAGGQPFFFLAGFAGLSDMDNLTSIQVKNFTHKFNEDGVPMGKRAVVQALIALKP